MSTRTPLALAFLCSVLLVVGTIAAEKPETGKASGTSSISYDAKRKVFLLQTDHSSYAFGLASNTVLVNLHWGGRLTNTDDVPEPWETNYLPRPFSRVFLRYNRFEYPTNRSGDFLAPCLKIEKPDKLVDLTLAFASHRIEENHLQVELRAKDYPFHVVLHYEVYPEFDLINRWVEVKNEGQDKILIENIQSARNGTCVRNSSNKARRL